jgi:hypothetical protein
MTRPRASATSGITCTQLVTRFDRNGERHIGMPLLRQVRGLIREDMQSEGADGSMVWRLARTPSGITVTAFWHARREVMIEMARPARRARLERRRLAIEAGVANRRRIGRRCIPNGVAAAIA